MADGFHYPPDVFELVVEALVRLNKSKSGVLLFLRGAGVDSSDLADVERTVSTARDSISKGEIARRVLARVNARGDSGLRPRRELIKRIVEFEDFTNCWPEDQLKARGAVAAVREAVNKKDAFTRMQEAHEAAQEVARAPQRAAQAAAAERRAKIEQVNGRLAALFAMDDRPHERGKLLEGVLNDLFRAYGILVREDFRRKDPDTTVVLEQIDGVIDLDGEIHLVEMKWLNAPVGTGEFLPHLGRLFLRANARGIFISSAGFTEPVIKECATALTQKTMFLCTLHEVVMLLQRQDDLVRFLRRKSQAAIVDKNPFLQLLA